MKEKYQSSVYNALYTIVSKGIKINDVEHLNDPPKMVYRSAPSNQKQILCYGGIRKTFPFSDDAMRKLGSDTIDYYIDTFEGNCNMERKTQLHYWYVDKIMRNGKEYVVAHGNVSGHKKLADAIFIHTSEVQYSVIDRDNGELIIKTSNTEYHCPLEYCQWEKQDNATDLIPEYEWIKKNYENKLKIPEIGENKVLLTLSNFDSYYYHGTYCKLSSKKKTVSFRGYPHIGTFQDSFLIHSDDFTSIDIRYFPHCQNIKFYSELTDGMPLFVENIGDVILYVDAHVGLIRLAPGERKEVKIENIEQEKPVLPSGDLYPAEIID